METKRNKTQSEQKQQTRKTCQNQDTSRPLQPQIQHPGDNSMKNTVFQKVARACYKNTSIIFRAEKPNIPPCFTSIFLIFLMLSWELNDAWEKEENKTENNAWLGKYNQLRKASWKSIIHWVPVYRGKPPNKGLLWRDQPEAHHNLAYNGTA